ncbi:hypothetical protein JTB14_009677 [Gonioctena quinquepunctata]|nr:hypothetical protein JTB14_009677 [Gonioctena quinquepunctata]
MYRKIAKQTAANFTCQQCDKGYKHQRSLSFHRRVECGKDPFFKCPHCSYRGKRKTHLKQHMKLRHKVDNASPLDQTE